MFQHSPITQSFSSSIIWISRLVKSLPSQSGALSPFPAWSPSHSTPVPVWDPSRTSWSSTAPQREQSCPCPLLQMCPAPDVPWEPSPPADSAPQPQCISHTRKRSSRGKTKLLSSGSGTKRVSVWGFPVSGFQESQSFLRHKMEMALQCWTQGISCWDANPERTELTKGFLLLGATANYAESYNLRLKRASSKEILGATDP